MSRASVRAEGVRAARQRRLPVAPPLPTSQRPIAICFGRGGIRFCRRDSHWPQCGRRVHFVARIPFSAQARLRDVHEARGVRRRRARKLKRSQSPIPRRHARPVAAPIAPSSGRVWAGEPRARRRGGRPRRSRGRDAATALSPPPSSRSRCNSAFSCSTSCAVRPAAGSSSSNNRGRETRARAISIWRRCQVVRSAARACEAPA